MKDGEQKTLGNQATTLTVDTIVGAIGTGLYILTAVCAVLCVVLYLVSRKVEPKKAN